MKKLVVLMPTLKMGGAQRSLLYMLTELNKSKIDVTLILFSEEGDLIDELPDGIRVLYFENYYTYLLKKYSDSLHVNIMKSILKFDFKYLFRFIISNIRYKLCKNLHEEQKVWYAVKDYVSKVKIDADFCISYMQGSATYFLVDKILTNGKKFAMFNTDYEKAKYNNIFDRNYFKHLDKIICVSDQCNDTLRKSFNNFDEKIITIENVTSIKFLENSANEQYPICDDKDINTIVSVGRLEVYIKGYDFIVDVANRLSTEGYDFRWYILGEGSGRMWIEKKIKEYSLENKLILLGNIVNPYPYIKNADFVVQASRFEGKGRVLIEANILKTPIISTDFDSAFSEIINGENGYIVPKDANKLFDAVKYLLDFPEECDRLRTNMVGRKNTGIENYHKLFEIE